MKQLILQGVVSFDIKTREFEACVRVAARPQTHPLFSGQGDVLYDCYGMFAESPEKRTDRSV